MDLSETGTNTIFGVIIVIFLVANVLLRNRKAEKTPLGKVVGIFSEVNKNQKLTESFSFHRQAGKFKTSSWKRNKDKVDFLPSELMQTLSKAFDMSEDVNERINAARKYGSDSYMAGIDVDKLKEPLAKSEQGLKQWLKENMQNPEYTPKRRGLFG